MSDAVDTDTIGMSVINGCLVVPLQTEIYEDALLAIQRRILERIHHSDIHRGVIDLSALSVVDSFAFQILSDTVRMAAFQGATFVLSGLQPGVVSALVELDLDFTGVRTVLNLEDAFEMLMVGTSNDGEPAEEDEPESTDGEEPDDGEDNYVSPKVPHSDGR